MSDVPVTVVTKAADVLPAAQSSGSVWGYVAGGAILLILAGIYGYRKINTPAFLIKQVRKRNQKEMKKHGVTNSEFMVDLDKLLDSILEYANEHKMKGSGVVELIKPLNDKERVKTPKDMYQSMIYIANKIGDTELSRYYKNKSKQVKASSNLMNGLLKRAGI